MKLTIIAIILILSSCNTFDSNPNPHNFKYRIYYGFGNTRVDDVSTGEIEYLKDGRIKYESFNYGHPDTVIVGGTYLIKKY